MDCCESGFGLPKHTFQITQYWYCFEKIQELQKKNPPVLLLSFKRIS